MVTWLRGHNPNLHQLDDLEFNVGIDIVKLACEFASAALKKRRLEDIFKCPKSIAVKISKMR